MDLPDKQGASAIAFDTMWSAGPLALGLWLTCCPRLVYLQDLTVARGQQEKLVARGFLFVYMQLLGTV